MPAKRKAEPQSPAAPLNTYGWKPQASLTCQAHYDAAAFATRRSVDFGCPDRHTLFRRVSDHFLPGHFEWHSWTEKVIHNACDYSLLAMPGCSNSAKTYNAVGFAVCWWLCAPTISSVMLVSTSKQSLRKRGWAEVIRCHTNMAGERFGNFIDSRMIWQHSRSDDKHAIVGRAVEEGPVQRVADDIKGIHTKRQLVIIDEATSVPTAIFEACANLWSYPEEFILIMIGNPLNRLDQFGRFCEPEGGWLSVDVETEEWDGKPQELIGGRKPRVIRFDAEKSPNIVEGKLVSRHLPVKEKVRAMKEASGGKSPKYWQDFRGFWPPEGLTCSVLSETALTKGGAYGTHRYIGAFFLVVGFVDPSRGGDRPILRFAKLGLTDKNHISVELLPAIELQIDVTVKEPVFYQLAHQIIKYAGNLRHNGVAYQCFKRNFGLDATGDGAGLADILDQIWKEDGQVIRVVFSEAASDEQCNYEDIRPAKDVYLNKRAEIWFRVRDAVNAGQMAGLDKDTATELCSMEFEIGKRTKLMSKDEYRAKFGRSPDLGDATCGVMEVARLRGFKLAQVGQTVERGQGWDQQVQESQSIHEDTYQPEEIEMQAEVTSIL